MPIIEIIVALLQAIGLMALIAVAYGGLLRSRLSSSLLSLTAGFLFGLGAISSMLLPVEILPGIIIDGRAIFVGLGAAFGGLPAGLIAAVMGGGFRLYLGGAGAIAGATGIVLAAVLGLLWMKLFSPKVRSSAIGLAIAGAMISTQFVAVYMLPVAFANQMMVNVYPLLLISSIISALILGLLLDREQRMLTREQNLKYDADMDFLTGLPNRRHFTRTAASGSQLTGDPEGQHTLAILDIDHFKKINDHWGHDAGDRVLKALAGKLTQACRAGDVVARLGGEEFGILLINTDIVTAKLVVDRILTSIRAITLEIGDSEFSVTASAGLTEFSFSGASLDDAMLAADKALYKAKQAGRNRAEVGGLDLAA